jgi:uncharacterized membrane protein
MSVNPFDARTVLLAKHAQHVVLIHFPIALFTAAVRSTISHSGRRAGRWLRRRISIFC